MNRVYISGPMTGLPKLNFPAFHAEASRLRALGYSVVNPAELNLKPDTSWEECMRVDLKEMLDCHILAKLPGCQNSKGAQLEIFVADSIGMAIVDAASITDRPEEG